jgi:uncharacterized membrane protein YozB (DUF420 family)
MSRVSRIALTAVGAILFIGLLMSLRMPVYKFFQGVRSGSPGIVYLEWLNIAIVGVISGIFTILGVRLAKRKNRNPYAWLFACLFFNLWAYLVLYNLPRKT